MIEYFQRFVTPEEYNHLRRSVGWHEFDATSVGKSLERSMFCITVTDGNKLVGMGRVIGDERLDFYIKDVIVIPEYQGMHIGTGIMERVMTFISRNAINGASVVLMSATGKEGFYRKFGFTERPNSNQGAGMNLEINH